MDGIFGYCIPLDRVLDVFFLWRILYLALRAVRSGHAFEMEGRQRAEGS